MVLIWEFATAFVGHEAWAILNAQPVVALYRAALCDSWLMADLKMALTHPSQYLRQGDIDWEVALAAMRPVFSGIQRLF